MILQDGDAPKKARLFRPDLNTPSHHRPPTLTLAGEMLKRQGENAMLISSVRNLDISIDDIDIALEQNHPESGYKPSQL